MKMEMGLHMHFNVSFGKVRKFWFLLLATEKCRNISQVLKNGVSVISNRKNICVVKNKKMLVLKCMLMKNAVLVL